MQRDAHAKQLEASVKVAVDNALEIHTKLVKEREITDMFRYTLEWYASASSAERVADGNKASFALTKEKEMRK